MCDMVDDSPQFFFVDLDPAPGVTGVDPRDPTKSRSGHLAAAFPFMSLEIADNIDRFNPRHRMTLPHQPAYDFTALFWVAVWCVNMVEDVADAGADDSGIRHKPIWRDEQLDDIVDRKEWILNVYNKARLAPSPAFERYLPMLERWRDIHARVRTQAVNSRRPTVMWRGGDGLTRIRIYDPIYTEPIERSTIRAAILEG